MFRENAAEGRSVGSMLPAASFADARSGVGASLALVTDTGADDVGGPSSTFVGDVSADRIAALHAWLLSGSGPADAASRVAVLRALEELAAGVVAVQSQVLVDLRDDEVRAAKEAAVASGGTAHDKRGRQIPVTAKSAARDAESNVAQQVGLALRVSPHRARSLLGVAKVWHTEMPRTLGALREGRLSQERATLLVKETACLTLADRQIIDAELCADPAVLEGVGTRRLGALINEHAGRLDPAALAKRAAKAVSDRCVTLRPAPDTMTYLTALLPVAEGVQAYAALKVAAETSRHTGSDERPIGQIMADTLVERVTGQVHAADVPVTVHLVVSDEALLAGGHEPAVVLDGTGAGHGAIPAEVARNLVANGLDLNAAWLRAVYTTSTGNLIGASSKQRFFTDGLADLLRVRDQGICRTSWCDAPIRHLDHVTPAAHGGDTTLANGQGLCAACNQAKETPGWSAATETDPGTGRHTVTTTTPSGQQYRSVAPEPPRPARPDQPALSAPRPGTRSGSATGPVTLSCRVRQPVRHHLRPVARAA
ncbi:HNH endonuclease [Promicromonospora umidemergens]|uniref:HNH nuclease domain-containing protein n=1 Tax=Promicromonospora umidemergens TaxID=629679 RepID=A0ABP8XVN3_9MICO|nr:DUF222 domain-containing protein [Promicromonospora umidemergens]